MIDDETLIAALPALARKKFEHLRRHAQTVRAAATAIADEMGDNSDRLNSIIGDWRRQRAAYGEDVPEPAETARFRKRIASLQTELDVVAATVSAAVAPYEACRNWITSVRYAGSRIVTVPPPSLPAARNRDHAKQIAHTRTEIDRLGLEYETAEAAHAPAADLKRRALDALDEIAERGRPHLYLNNRHSDPIGLAERLRLGSIASPDGRAQLTVDAAAFVAWALRDVIAEKIDTLIDAAPSGNVLTDAERDERLAALAAQLLDAERREESLIEAGEAAGMRIDRRADADPRALLCVNDE